MLHDIHAICNIHNGEHLKLLFNRPPTLILTAKISPNAKFATFWCLFLTKKSYLLKTGAIISH